MEKQGKEKKTGNGQLVVFLLRFVGVMKGGSELLSFFGGRRLREWWSVRREERKEITSILLDGGWSELRRKFAGDDEQCTKIKVKISKNFSSNSKNFPTP